MTQVHQKGSLAAPIEGSVRRGVNPLSIATREKLSPSNRLVRQIAAELRRRSLSPREAALVAKETPAQMTLILRGKLFGLSVERLQGIADRLAEKPK